MNRIQPTRYAVLVNHSANDGNADRRWQEIAAAFTGMLPADTRYHHFTVPGNTDRFVESCLREKVNGFISAGGDGSAHHLLNQLITLTEEHTSHLFIGGVGLGSSNDFIKPAKHFIRNIPVRTGVENALLSDVGKAVFTTPDDQELTRYFIANASMGITAEANWLFNRGDAFIRFTQKRWVNVAILYTAIRTILTYRNFPASLQFNGTRKNILLSNLAVLKNPHVSGRLCYDQSIRPDDGMLGLNYCDGMNRFELLRTLLALSKGRFSGRPGTFTGKIKQLGLQVPGVRALEMDGEVYPVKKVRFSVLPGAIHILSL